MELRMHPVVVPSNGPPPTDQAIEDDNDHQWDGDYEIQSSGTKSFDSQTCSENQNVQMVPSSYGYAGPSIQHSGHGSWRSRNPRSKEKEARALFHQLSKCEDYQKYRERQPKSSGRQKDQKWSDSLEEAFFLGCRQILDRSGQ